MTIPDPESIPLLKVPDVAAWLGIGRSACYEAIHRGDIPHLRIGRRLYIPTAQVRILVGLGDNHTEPTTDETPHGQKLHEQGTSDDFAT